MTDDKYNCSLATSKFPIQSGPPDQLSVDHLMMSNGPDMTSSMLLLNLLSNVEKQVVATAVVN